jgi:hypothetical protein
VCRNYYLLADEIESLALEAIRTQIKSPQWSSMVRKTLESVVDGEVGNPFTREREERRKQLEDVGRQIENIVQAIQKAGFSEALETSLRSLEIQRDTLRENLKQMETFGLPTTSGPSPALQKKSPCSPTSRGNKGDFRLST